MKPEIKAKWLAALRGGQYKQARHKLTNGKGFCCLGVLCNLHALENGEAWTRERPTSLIRYLGSSSYLPDVVAQWAGLDPAPKVGDCGLHTHNDGNRDMGVGRKGFRKIADLIEAHL